MCMLCECVISTLNILLFYVRQTSVDLIFIDCLRCVYVFFTVNMRFICDKYHINTSIIIITEDERVEKMRRIENEKKI